MVLLPCCCMPMCGLCSYGILYSINQNVLQGLYASSYQIECKYRPVALFEVIRIRIMSSDTYLGYADYLEMEYSPRSSNTVTI